MELHPVGVVHSPVRNRGDMPQQGVSGTVEIYPGYVDALEGVEKNSHLILLGWMHQADRTLLRAVPRKISPDLPIKGVFSLRSPSRPNPISMSVVRLIGIHRHRFLDVAELDLIDGTPVLDIKPYQTGWDCVFSAVTGDRSEKILKIQPEAYQADLIREAVNYHGELCPGVAIGVRMAALATRVIPGDLRRASVSFTAGPDPCINDAIIGITGATMGNRRLFVPVCYGQAYTISGPHISVVFAVLPHPREIDAILAADEGDLFSVTILPNIPIQKTASG